jgi:hypothetical protein
MTKIIITMFLAALSACGGGGDECQVIQKDAPQELQLIGNMGKDLKQIQCVP